MPKRVAVEVLVRAIQQGDCDRAIYLLEQHPEYVHAGAGRNMIEGTKIIDVAAYNRNAVAVLRHLLDHGVDPNGDNPRGWTPLHCAANANNTEGIELLLQHGANLEAAAADGQTPMDATFYHRSTEAFQLLLDRGGVPAVSVAVAHGRLDLAEELLQRNDSSSRQRVITEVLDDVIIHRKDHRSALLLAAHQPELAARAIYLAAGAKEDLALLKELLDRGIDPNTLDEDRNTPLHHAARHDNLPGIDLLLDRGAELERVNVDGFTPLDCTHQWSKAAFEKLLSRGAEPGVFIAVARDRMDLLAGLLQRGPPYRIPSKELLFAAAEGCEDYEWVMEMLRQHGIEE